MTFAQDVSAVRPDHVAPPRLTTLTGLRFVAAFLVFVYHAQYVSIFADQVVQRAYGAAVVNAGALGVSFFFVLSGFVLAWSARPADTPRRFWRRRLVKVFPNHVVVFLVALVLLVLAGNPLRLPQVIANLFLVQTWTGDLSSLLYAVNGVSWSLSVEVVFYLLFPLLLLAIRRIRDEHLWRWAAGVAAPAVLMPVLVQPFVADQPRFPFRDISWPEMWLLNFCPPVRLLEFAFGMLLARIVRTGRRVPVPVLPAAALVAAAYVASLFLPMIWGFAALFVVPLGLLIAAVAGREVTGHRSWLASRPMVRLGEASYAFFLLHFTLLFALHGAVSGQVTAEGASYAGRSWGVLGAVLFLLGALASSLLLSWLLYTAVERPAMRRWAGAGPRQPIAEERG